MRWISATFVLCAFLVSSLAAADLYRVTVRSDKEAEWLRATGVEAVARTTEGYLVLADDASAHLMKQFGLDAALLATEIRKGQLAVDIRHDRAGIASFPVVYEQGGLRFYRVDEGLQSPAAREAQLAPLLAENLPITYSQPAVYNRPLLDKAFDLDSLINLIDQDSLRSYVERLQAFYRRVAGTDSCLAASEWLMAKFRSFGYDSVVYDSFFFPSESGNRTGRNVVAVKAGRSQPQWQVIVGAHFDGVGTSPAADDNGSGTAGVLEIARALANIETDVTFIFIPFDAEEYGLYGSWHYANEAYGRGDHIILMLDFDMIGHYNNNTQAMLIQGEKKGYSLLWADLADSLVGIQAQLWGNSGGSDHFPFSEHGCHVVWANEYNISTNYHRPSDSATHMNFDYMTRMVKASLATVYTANRLPAPAVITAVRDVGDGGSLQIDWIPMNPELVDHFRIYFAPTGQATDDSIIVSGSESSAILTGLTQGQEYQIHIMPYNASGQTAFEFQSAYGVPRSAPDKVCGLTAMPVTHAVRVTWNRSTELDLSHYRLVRDGALLPDMVYDTSFVDNDPSPAPVPHRYKVFAIDFDGHPSDTTAQKPVICRAAQLEAGRILAVNRSAMSPNSYLVVDTITGAFLRVALTGYDYQYYSDTAYESVEKTDTLRLDDLIDYELVVIGGESGGTDDIAGSPYSGGILDSLAYYLSIGGKVILFGRWGTTNYDGTLPVGNSSFTAAYESAFDLSARHMTLTGSTATELYSDLIGGYSQAAGYPELTWDSLATVAHSAPYTGVSGIPCGSYAILSGSGAEVLYTYHSSDGGGPHEGQPVVWRQAGPNRKYVYFGLPLSFMDRSQAIRALNRAILDLGLAGAATQAVPDTAAVGAGPTAMVDLLVGNLAGDYTVDDIDLTSVVINGLLKPVSTDIVPSHPGFSGGVLRLAVSSHDLASCYGSFMGIKDTTYTVSFRYQGDDFLLTTAGDVTIIGRPCGDVNGDYAVNVGDAVYVINYIFKGGAAPNPLGAGDANCDHARNVGDAVYVINYIFKGGVAPCCP